jgi:hypothetical protein
LLLLLCGNRFYFVDYKTGFSKIFGAISVSGFVVNIQESAPFKSVSP